MPSRLRAYALTGSFGLPNSSVAAIWHGDPVHPGCRLPGRDRFSRAGLGWICPGLGQHQPGVCKSISGFSSLLFCSIHLLDFLSGRPFPSVLLQSLEAFFLGVFLAGLVLSSKSIYPATFFHGLLNLSAYMNFAGQGLEPSPVAWLFLSLITLSLAALSLYMFNSVYKSARSASAGVKKNLLNL